LICAGHTRNDKQSASAKGAMAKQVQVMAMQEAHTLICEDYL
jgi:hypothetical protein